MLLPVVPPGRTVTVAGQSIELFRCDRIGASLKRDVCADRSEKADALRLNDNTGMLSNDRGHKHGTTDLPLAVCRGCPIGRAHRGLPPVELPQAPPSSNGTNGHGNGSGRQERAPELPGETFSRGLRDRTVVRDQLRAEVKRPSTVGGRPPTILEHPGRPHDDGPKCDTFAGWARRLKMAEMTLRQRKKRGLPIEQILSPERLPNPTTNPTAFVHAADDDGGRRTLEAAGYRVQPLKPAKSMPGSWVLLVTAANQLKPTKETISALLSHAGIAIHHIVVSSKGMTVVCINSRLARQRTDVLTLAKVWASGAEVEERLRAAVYDLMELERDE